MTVAEATAIVDAVGLAPTTVEVPLGQSVGLCLAKDVRCDRDSPPFEKSLMDGYAVRRADLGRLPCELVLRGRIMAGQTAQRPLGAGETMAIMTGAPLPAGADTVVPVEQARLNEEFGKVRFDELPEVGRHVAGRGSEARAGSVVLQAGTRMGPAQIAVAAGVGAAELRVFAAPRVAVLSTGDELVPIEQTPAAAQIRATNNAMLATLLARWNCRAVDLGIVRDDPQAIERAISTGLEQDVLLVSGGMSVGERDYVPGILRKLGAEMRITKLRIKPGKPFVFAQMPAGKFVFGLPGNPVSAFVCTVCLVRRLLERLGGGGPQEHKRAAVAGCDLAANGPREFYQPAIVSGRSIVPLAWKGSADIYTLARANALMVRGADDPPQPAGAMVEYLDV